MAGIIGIYGLVVSVLISDGLNQHMALYTGFIQLGAGLSVGLAGLAAGYVNLLATAEVMVRQKANTLVSLQFRNRYRRRRRCPRHSSTTSTFRWHDLNSHFRRSLGSIWLDRGPAYELQGHNGCQLQVGLLIMRRLWVDAEKNLPL